MEQAIPFPPSTRAAPPSPRQILLPPQVLAPSTPQSRHQVTTTIDDAAVQAEFARLRRELEALSRLVRTPAPPDETTIPSEFNFP